MYLQFVILHSSSAMYVTSLKGFACLYNAENVPKRPCKFSTYFTGGDKIAFHPVL